MVNKASSNKARLHRHKRVRGKISGTATCPRLNVFRSNKNIYAQIIDDVAGVTLCAASTLDAEFSGNGGNKEAAHKVGELLAITGAIKAEVLDRETLAANFMLRLAKFYPDAVEQRYKFRPDPACNGFELLEQAAKKRGFLISGGEYDLERMAGVLLDEYRGGKLGRITLEMPEADV